MDVRTVVLAAGVRTPIKVPGRFFMLLEAPSPLTVKFQRALSTFREVARNVEAGFVSFPGDWSDTTDGFDGVEFESAVAQTITIGISDRAADYRRVVGIIDVRGPNDGTVVPDQPVDNTAGGVVVAAANGNRRWIHVQNVGGENCRVGPGTVAATAGMRLVPGASHTFQTTAAIRAIREGGANTSVAVTEETRT